LASGLDPTNTILARVELRRHSSSRRTIVAGLQPARIGRTTWESRAIP